MSPPCAPARTLSVATVRTGTACGDWQLSMFAFDHPRMSLRYPSRTSVTTHETYQPREADASMILTDRRFFSHQTVAPTATEMTTGITTAMTIATAEIPPDVEMRGFIVGGCDGGRDGGEGGREGGGGVGCTAAKNALNSFAKPQASYEYDKLAPR